MKTELYFAFGSNLSTNQMVRRCPSATIVSTATLPGWRLAFAGHSVTRGGCGVATITRETMADQVVGVVYEISTQDLARLDRYEGHPFSYKRERLCVDLIEWPEILHPWVYIKSAPLNYPSDSYLDLVLDGYDEHGLDTALVMQAMDNISDGWLNPKQPWLLAG